MQGRLGNCTDLLSQWALKIVKCKKDEDQVLGALAASVTPQESVDSTLSAIAPRKQARQTIDLRTPIVELDEKLYVMSFYGSARVKKGGKACSAIAWRLLTWTIVEALQHLDTSTVNEDEYEGMLQGFSLLKSLERERLIISGDSNLVMRQMRGEIECEASGLSMLRAHAFNELQSWLSHRILHVKRDWNQSAYQLASTALHQKGWTKSVPGEERLGLEAINRVPELLIPKDQNLSTKIYLVIRSRSPIRTSGKIIQEEVVQ